MSPQAGKARAQELTVDQLATMALCRCMNLTCTALHWADLSDEQQAALTKRWER